MGVTRDDTLIFCPYCSSISPIMNAEIGNSQEEADYKLALKLQKEEDAAAESAQNDTAEVGWAEWIGNKVGYSSPTKNSNSSSTVNTRQNTDQRPRRRDCKTSGQPPIYRLLRKKTG